MADEPDLIWHVVEALEQLAIPYMIGGSMALGAWARPRMTHDLDLIVDLPAERIAEFCSYFPAERYLIDPEAMADAFRQRNRASWGMYSFIDMETGFKADLFPLRAGDPTQQAALARRRRVELFPGLLTFVYAPDDLLIQKLRWYVMGESELQFSDCVNLLISDMRKADPQIEWAYVESWATQLGERVIEAWLRLKAAVATALNAGQ